MEQAKITATRLSKGWIKIIISLWYSGSQPFFVGGTPKLQKKLAVHLNLENFENLYKLAQKITYFSHE